MNRAKCFSVVDYAHAAAHNATLATSYANINAERSRHFAQLCEEALQAAREALDEAREEEPAKGPHPIFADILAGHRKAA